MEAAAITLSPGDSQIYWEDGTLMYKLEKHSAWDASEAIGNLANVLQSGD